MTCTLHTLYTNVKYVYTQMNGIRMYSMLMYYPLKFKTIQWLRLSRAVTVAMNWTVYIIHACIKKIDLF